MYRDRCVICNDILNKRYTHKNQPITYCPKPIGSEAGDIFQDLEYGACISCGSVQLMTLIDPKKLYEDPHNITYNTPTWAAHHKSFAEFLQNHMPTALPIMEIGGSSGVLASLLLDVFPGRDYKIMDFCASADIPKGVKFIQGNCETYDFSGEKVIIMSHLFEHLYEPRRFIEQLSKADVDFAAISIPNMTELLRVSSPAVVHAEHTYFLERRDAEYMFSCHGYRLLAYSAFKGHSHFMIFKKENAASLLPLSSVDRADAILSTFRERDAHFGAVQLEDDALIVPAGIYGQIIYNHTRHLGTVNGFLDNDPAKQGRRLYGTPCTTFSFDHLINIKKPTIYIHGGPYTSEIKEQIMRIRPDSVIYEL
jgi:hypothetical protein